MDFETLIPELKSLGFSDRDDEELRRYLIARQGNVQDAAAKLKQAHQFRLDFDAFTFADRDEGLEKEILMKRMYLHYHSKSGHPLFILTPGNHYPRHSDSRQLTRLVILVLDEACRRAPQFDVITDMSGLSVAN